MIGARDFGGMDVTDGRPVWGANGGVGMTFALGVECNAEHTYAHGRDRSRTLTATACLDRRDISDLYDLLGEWLAEHGRP